MKKSALVIGSFIKEEHIFKGKIKTLGIDATITLHVQTGHMVNKTDRARR